MEKRIFETEFRGRKLTVEVGELAKQADGAVLVRYGDTVVLSTVCVSHDANILSDFFPLMVLYQEKLYSVGKIPGGFIKREGRPTENATLAARMIDRPMRPLFPEDFRNEVQVVNTVLSVDPDNSPELTAMLGSSIATSISKVPFDGPIAGVKVGRINGKFIINPTVEELEKTDIDLTVAGTMDAINMVEAGAKEVSEDDMLEALMFGHDAVKELVKFENKIIKEIGQEKMEYEALEITDELKDEISSLAKEPLDSAMRIKDKLEKYAAIDKVKEDVVAKFEYENEDLDKDALNELLTKVKLCLGKIEYEVFRKIVVKEKKRADGRKMTEIRPLSTDIDLLPRTHGSALFTRGETQSLSVVTLGALGEHQIIDGLSPEDQKRFMLHYNFPQFSVGETGRYGAPGRREIGHGALGERALAQVMPSEEEFPYTVRVVSEILESNGSSSQASICAGCMALMAAGVPIKAPVAGIAMGLITDGDDYTILTDIQGMEDHLGDMDFKVAGTKDGICALQMDIKIKGITKEILSKALAQAKKARLEILKVIAKQIKEPRKVDIEEDGRVIIYHTDSDIINKTADMIKNVIKEVEIGKIYTGRVVKVIEELGCFVELWEGCEGLVHISQLSDKRVAKTSDVVNVGDEIIVKATGFKNGKLNLSRKEVLVKDKIKDEKPSKKKEEKTEE